MALNYSSINKEAKAGSDHVFAFPLLQKSPPPPGLAVRGHPHRPPVGDDGEPLRQEATVRATVGAPHPREGRLRDRAKGEIFLIYIYIITKDYCITGHANPISSAVGLR